MSVSSKVDESTRRVQAHSSDEIVSRSAETPNLDKHGPAECYKLVTPASRIKVPIVVLGGSRVNHTRRKDMARDLALAAVTSPRPEHIITEGGNHSLNNKKREASEVALIGT